MSKNHQGKLGEILPMQFAYMDGRDPDARPPLTVMMINLWGSPERWRVTGRVRHGQRVLVLSKVLHMREQRYYYLVRRWWARGWVPESFLSKRRTEPIGDEFWHGARPFLDTVRQFLQSLMLDLTPLDFDEQARDALLRILGEKKEE